MAADSVNAGLAAWISPAGGERWAVGSSHYLTWTGATGAAAVVEYTTDGGKTWLQAAGERSTDSAGESALLWEVPAAESEGCMVRLRTDEGETISARFSIIPSQRCDGYRWTAVTLEAAFAGRDGAGAVTLNDRMYLLGGWNPKDPVHFPKICNSEVWSSADGLEWTLETRQAPWEGRHTAGYVAHEGWMWIIGGDANQGHYQPDAWRSADGAHWELVSDSLPWGRRVLHHTVAFDGRIWVMGGQKMHGFVQDEQEEALYADVWCSEDGSSWERVTEQAPWAPRGMIGGTAVLNGRIWLLGGGTYDTPNHDRTYHNDVWSTTDGVEWECHLARAPWAPRQYHDVAAFDGRLWVMEGWDGTANRNDAWYSQDGVNWYELPDTPWEPRHAASVFVHDGALWMVAGNNMFPDVWRLTRD